MEGMSVIQKGTEMERYYFTFGSRDGFPYQNTYLIVIAAGYDDAVKGFREKHPDVDPGRMNCSGCYGEEEWKTAGKPYACRVPAEVIWTENCFGRKPEGYDDLFIYVPEMRHIIRISEGGRSCLTPENTDDGYADCICYDQYRLDAGMPETDWGRMLLKETLNDRYRCMADCIPDVLDMEYGSRLVRCMIL